EVLADLRIHAPDLPAPRQVHDDPTIGEFLERITIARAAHATPYFLRHRAVAVPVVEFLRHRLIAVVDDEIAFRIEIFRAHADRGAREAMTAAVEGDRERHLRCLRYLARRIGPLIPGRLWPGERHVRLLEERLVDVRARDGELRHHSVDALVTR